MGGAPPQMYPQIGQPQMGGPPPPYGGPPGMQPGMGTVLGTDEEPYWGPKSCLFCIFVPIVGCCLLCCGCIEPLDRRPKTADSIKI